MPAPDCAAMDGSFRTVDELELGTPSWVHWFNECLLHSAIGYLTPLEKEQEYYRQNQPQQHQLPGELALH